jgi:hypothetical protein
MTEDCFARVCGHKAQSGIRMIADALHELEISRRRSVMKDEAFDLARKNLLALNMLVNVLVVGAETKGTFDA